MTRSDNASWRRPASADLMLIALALCGFVLRVFQLGKESIWVDEGFTWRLAKLTLPQYIDNVQSTIRNILPPLYFQIMHYWTGLFGTSEFSLRFPSVVFGTVSIVGIYLLGKSLFGRESGIISALLLSVSLFHIQYSQEARMYELLSLLSIAAFCLLARLIRDNRWSSAFWLVIVNALLIYTHHYGFFIVFSQFAFVAFTCLTRREYLRRSITRWLIAGLVFALAIYPWLFVFINQARKVSKDPWLLMPTAASVISLFTDYSGGIPVLCLYVLVIIAWLFAKGFSSTRVFEKQESLDYNWHVLLSSWLFVPILLAFVYSQTVSPIFGSKYLIASSIPFYCLASKAISSVRWKYVKYGLLAVIVIMSAMPARKYYREVRKEQWRQAAGFVEKYAQENDLVIANAGFGLENGFNYYARRSDLVRRPFPGRTAELNTPVTPDDSAELLNAVIGHDRVWVIYSHSRDGDDVIGGTLSEAYIDAHGFKQFVGIKVRLFEKAGE